ncbi:MAG: DUF3108 domain-containing protein [Gammaproteobacteria bacterium]|nr:DUF3108 domain-containing protein [Gammaproteobacteria bacterium]
MANKRIIPLLITVLVGLLGGGAFAAPLPEFSATYRVEKGGMAARMVMTLRREGSLWRFESHSEPNGLLTLFDAAYVSETSMLEQQAAGLRPISYEFNAKKHPSDRDRSSVFDWENGTLKSTRGSKSRSADLQAGTFDRLSVLLEIVAQLRAGAKEMAIPVASKGKIRTRQFVLEETELIEVVAGSFETVRVRELRGTSKRHTTSWFAPGEHYLPVRMDQFRKGKHVGRVELIEIRWPG